MSQKALFSATLKNIQSHLKQDFMELLSKHSLNKAKKILLYNTGL